MKLIPEWRQGWKLWSARLMALAALWLGMPEAGQAKVIALLWQGATAEQVAAVLVMAGLVARFVLQTKVRKQ